ncbi:MAG: hydrogenase maturation protease [Chloroflexi bacterium]|nr:hydrogenase maturation protease [Chloroflexota bacterium]
MVRTLIIGVGNPLRGDDGIGQVAAQSLLERSGEIVISSEGEKSQGATTAEISHSAFAPFEMTAVSVRAVHQLTPELAASFSEHDRVIIIDANAENKAGQITVAQVDPATVLPHTLTHHLAPAQLLALARALYQSNPSLYLVTIGGASFDYGDEMSPQIAAALPQVIQIASDLLEP